MALMGAAHSLSVVSGCGIVASSFEFEIEGEHHTMSAEANHHHNNADFEAANRFEIDIFKWQLRLYLSSVVILPCIP